jgi:hypothetical protein
MQSVFTHNGVTDFHGLFLVPMICAAGTALALALFFHPPKLAGTASVNAVGATS